LRLLFERALVKYQSRQRRTNLREAPERARLGRRESRRDRRGAIEMEVGGEGRTGGSNGREGNIENFGDAGMGVNERRVLIDRELIEW
jgi:hypothetical protein